MLEKSLADEREVELLLNENGFVMLLYAGGPLNHKYQWAQFDEQARKLEFITESGSIQEFGIQITKPLVSKLRQSEKMVMFQVKDDNKLGLPQMLNITKTAH